MNPASFTTAALGLKARADVVATDDERAALITAIHRLIRFGPVTFEPFNQNRTVRAGGYVDGGLGG